MEVVADCRWKEPGASVLVCQVCELALRNPSLAEYPRRNCKQGRAGPGSHLHAILAQLGVQPKDSCGCGEMMAKMDRWGSDGCREHREEILAHLTEAYHHASWAEVLQAGGRAVALGMPKTLAGLLRLAIERAEAGAAAES